MHTEKAFEKYIKHIYGYCGGLPQYPFLRKKFLGIRKNFKDKGVFGSYLRVYGSNRI